jgi:nitrogen fixation/metabolism regulation signal transduction histidine kinase
VLVSLLPMAFMSLFNFVLMNRAVDHWFSKPVTEMRDDSNQMALELSRYTAANARAEADSIAASIGAPPSGTTRGRSLQGAEIRPLLSQHEITLQGGFAIVYRDGRALASFHVPADKGEASEVKVKPWPSGPIDDDEQGHTASGGERTAGDATREPAATPTTQTAAEATILAAAQRTDLPLFSMGSTDYALGLAGMKEGGLIVVGLPMPYGLAATVSRLRADADSYWTLFRARRQIRAVYMQLLLMITSLALFASSWLALHLSKQVTRPVEALADAMDQIAAGDYAHRVQESATEELGDLVHSFNRMVGDLESSRAQVQESTIQISAANAALEARRSELETMLETIPNGVATLDAERRIVLANRALSELVDPGGQRPFLGLPIEEVFPAEVLEVLDRLLRRSHRMGSASSELEMTAANHDRNNGKLNLLATVALLEDVSGGAA